MDVSKKPARPRPAPRHACPLGHSCRSMVVLLLYILSPIGLFAIATSPT
jgi:hypothetical protein